MATIRNAHLGGGVWKARGGRSLYEEWRQKDEYIMDGPRYMLKQGGKVAQEKFGLIGHDGTVHHLIFAPKATRPSGIISLGAKAFGNDESTDQEHNPGIK